MKQPIIKILTRYTLYAIRCMLYAACFFIAIASIVLYIKGQTFAADPPHDSSNPNTNLRVYCNSCHSVHRAGGTGLTKSATNANLCLSCHVFGGMSGSMTKYLNTAMESIPGTSGTSHRWDATMPAAPSGPNSQYGLKAVSELPSGALKSRLGTYGNVITCSVCHNQHGQASTPWDPDFASRGRHFQRTDNDLNQMCEACHAYRAMSYTGARGDDGSANGTKKFSHPVGEALNSQGYDKTAPLDYDGTAQQTAPRYHANSAGDTNSTNNLVLDSSGKIRCLSCHRLHYVDSNGITEDAP